MQIDWPLSRSQSAIVNLKSLHPSKLLRWLPPLVLALPSIWMLASVPPLWRDVDGYSQVTAPPGAMTILQFSPLYCFGARIPLYAGCAWDSLVAHGELPRSSFFAHPILSDHGVFLLIALQHLLLFCAQMFLLRTASATWFVQVLLAPLFALNSAFYTFAHSVGTEAVALSASIWLIGCSVRIFKRRTCRRADWVWFGVSLVICVLLRHINAVQAALLPLAYLLSGGAVTTRARLRRGATKFPRRFVRRRLMTGALATIVALLSLAVASRTVRFVSRSARIHDRSTFGIAFVCGRLNFLARMEANERTALLGRLADRTDDPVLKRMLLAAPSGILETGEWHPAPYLQSLVQIMQDSGIREGSDYKLDQYQNRIAKIFLLSFERPFLVAVGNDFLEAGKMSIGELTTFPFATTQYSFRRLAEMPQLSNLNTFKGDVADGVLAREQQKGYYRWMEFSFWRALAGWLAIMVLCSIFLRGSQSRTAGLSIALGCLAIALLFLTCLLSEVLPRFLLPSWILLFAAAVLAVAGAAEVVLKRVVNARPQSSLPSP